MNAAQKMIEAAKSGDVATIRELLAADPQLVDARSDSGESAILLAVYYGRQEVAEVLLARGPNLNVFEASAVGATERLAELLKADASLVRSYSPDGWTPLHLAAFFGHEAAARLLVGHGADPLALSENANKNTALHAAVVSRRRDVVKFFLNAGADANVRTGYGWTALHLAAHGGNRELAEMLLSHGGDPKARTEEGQTPLDIALKEGHSGVAELLRQYERHTENP